MKYIRKKLTGNLRQVTSVYPIALSSVLLTSVSLALFIDRKDSFGKLAGERLIPFLMLLTVGVWFSESLWRSRRKIRVCGYGASVLIAAGLVCLSAFGSDGLQEAAARWRICFVLAALLLGVSALHRDSGVRFDLYCARLVCGLSCLVILCAVVMTGVALVMAAFVTLFLDGSDYELVIRSEFLVIGCLAGIGFLYLLSSEEQTLPRFFLMIVRRLLLPLLFSAFLVVYGYMLKILLTGIVPSNRIFGITAGLFAAGLLIWTMLGIFPDSDPFPAAGRKLPYFFIPFLFLQGYAIYARIRQFGLTPARCLGLVGMLFELIYIPVYHLKKRETAVMLRVAAVLAVFCLVLPGINIQSLSYRSQKAAFDRLITQDFASLPAEDQSRLAGAYYYLAGTAAGKAMLLEADPVMIDAIIQSGKTGDPEYDENEYIFRDFPLKDEDIRDFGRISWVTAWNPNENEEDILYDPASVSFFYTDSTSAFTVDIRPFMEACRESGAEGETSPAMIEVNDEKLFRVTSCSLILLPDGTLYRPDIQGILLEREQP